eukprot:m.23470 g.23470  ORF g.23470 m.23470 type:complete len:156 (+) comp4126_c0_seq2:300-767(+)
MDMPLQLFGPRNFYSQARQVTMADEDIVGDLQHELSRLSVEQSHLAERQRQLERRIRREQAIASVNAHFNDQTELDILQEMVRNLTEEEPPETKTACRKLLDGVYINIFDYVDGDYSEACDNRQALRRRCQLRGTFPLERAKNEHLQGLLKKLFF